MSGSSDQTIRVWSLDTFEQIQYDDRHEAEVTALHANTRHIMSGGADAKIKVIEPMRPCPTRSNVTRRSFRSGIVFLRRTIGNKRAALDFLDSF